jgi:hypothetical protein
MGQQVHEGACRTGKLAFEKVLAYAAVVSKQLEQKLTVSSLGHGAEPLGVPPDPEFIEESGFTQ